MASERWFGDNQPVSEERRRLILDLLRERRSIIVGAVDGQFGVSWMTEGRELAILAREGHARRIHGGAVPPDLAGHEDSFRYRLALEVGDEESLAGPVGKNTGDILNVDDGVSVAFPR